MRVDILDAIASAKDVTNAIILTHNIDFVFVQTVVLAAFRRCGHPTITIFADAQCAAESYASQAPVLEGLGTRYRVVPVAMDSGGRFHPKAVLLSGPQSATLLVGSGNLTFGGWRENGEIWSRFDTADDGANVFAEFEAYARRVIARVPLSGAVDAELREAFDRKSRPWFRELDVTQPRTLLGRVGDGDSLLNAMSAVVAKGPEELVVCTPFFDQDGEALQRLIAATAAHRATILCQPARTTLTAGAFEANKDRARLVNVSFEHVNEDGNARSAFLHAKFYAALNGDKAVVLAGSANCSRAALTTSGRTGNAELLVVRQMSTAEYADAFRNELAERAETVVLPVAIADDTSRALPALVILAARFDGGMLRVAFAPPSARITDCAVDGNKARVSALEPGVVNIPCSLPPRSVSIGGLVGTEAVRSPSFWVDHERLLRASARGRDLENIVRDRMQPGAWDATAWSDVLAVFCRHLAYTPTRDASYARPRGDEQKKASPATYTFADVFASDYRVPGVNGLGQGLPLDGAKERSLQHLLLHWFGVPGEKSAAGETSSISAVDEVEGDAPETLRLSSGRVAAKPAPTAADRRKIERILAQFESEITKSEYLGERPAEFLAGDLKVAAALLRTGLREAWVAAPEFFRITHRAWSLLFFGGSPSDGMGWLEYRVSTALDQSEFVDGLRSPELAAALLGWAFGVEDDGSWDAARFQLASAVAVARLPWLWDVGDRAAVARELELLLRYTDNHDGDVVSARINSAWTLMLRRGHALLRLEAASRRLPTAELRARIQRKKVVAGDLLWQGKAGYCIATETGSRDAKHKVPVLKLQGAAEITHFMAPFTIPVLDLLDERVVPPSPDFGPEPRQVLREFLPVLARVRV